MFILGSVASWRLVAAVPAVITLVLWAGMTLVPESPIWLLGNRGREEARAALGTTRFSW